MPSKKQKDCFGQQPHTFVPQGIRAKEVQDYFFFGQYFLPDQKESVADEGGWDMTTILVRHHIGLQLVCGRKAIHTPLNIMSTGTVCTALPGGIQRYLRQNHTKNRIYTHYYLFKLSSDLSWLWEIMSQSRSRRPQGKLLPTMGFLE